MKMTDRSANGFTLIEVIMVIMLMGIIAAIAATIIYQGARSYGEEDVRKDLATQGRLAIERMAREIRLIRCSGGPPGCRPSAADIPSSTSATELRFVNINYEGRGFQTSGTNLVLCSDSGCAASDILASNVSSLSFQYLDSAGNPAGGVGAIWTIVASITLTRDNQSVNFRIAVHPRKFRL